MKTLTALLVLVAAAGSWASEGKPDLNWSGDLESACRVAEKNNRLILLRQVHCDCDGSACPLLDVARKPAYLERPSTRLLVASAFVPAVAHAPAHRDVPGIIHPTFLPAAFRRDPSRVRTLIVTPTGHLIHRLDLCPHGGDVEAELAFAQEVREECFTREWAPRPGGALRLQALHAEHALTPEAWHPALAKGPSDPAARAWSGYAQIDVPWQPDLASAMKAAKQSDRLIFYYQVVGNLDKEGC